MHKVQSVSYQGVPISTRAGTAVGLSSSGPPVLGVGADVSGAWWAFSVDVETVYWILKCSAATGGSIRGQKNVYMGVTRKPYVVRHPDI